MGLPLPLLLMYNNLIPKDVKDLVLSSASFQLLMYFFLSIFVLFINVTDLMCFKNSQLYFNIT